MSAMSDISFEEEKAYSAAPQYTGSSSGFVAYVKKFGFAKTDKEAEVVLLSAAVGALMVAAIIAWVAFGESTKPVELPPVPPGVPARPSAL